MENPDDIELQQEEQEDALAKAIEALVTMARQLVSLRETRDTDKQALEKSEAEYRDFEQQFWATLDASPLKSPYKFDLGGDIGEVTFSLRETYFGRILDADKAADYFESSGRADEMFEPKVAKRRLNEFVRECLDNATPLPDGVDFYAQRGVTISKQKNE